MWRKNIKRKPAKEILVDSFCEIAESKDVDRISVKDITDNYGNSTASFYRQFRDKQIIWAHTQMVAKAMNQIGRDGYERNQYPPGACPAL